jgi:glycosyltransferase involved in cell wall biosynthesis
MKVAIVHPWFLELGGSEKVVEVLATMFPAADIFVMAMDPERVPASLRGRNIRTTALNRLLRYGFHNQHTYFMPLGPAAVESMDLRSYDLIISSCGPLVMGVNPSQDAIHVSYVHTPHRAWWDSYADRQSNMSWWMKSAFISTASRLRLYEFSAMQRVDHVVSNSKYIAQRVGKYFRRDSRVIYPPVDTRRGYLSSGHKDYYLTVSRLGPEKRIDLVIQACNQLRRPLKVVGVGRAEGYLRSLAGPTVDFLGRLPNDELREMYANCRALLFAADEDFGIVPVEAQSFGRPVIAYGHGGSLETVRVGDPRGKSDTGIYFNDHTVSSVSDGILRFEQREDSFSPGQIQEHAQKFDTEHFRTAFFNLVEDAFRGSVTEYSKRAS